MIFSVFFQKPLEIHFANERLYRPPRFYRQSKSCHILCYCSNHSIYGWVVPYVATGIVWQFPHFLRSNQRRRGCFPRCFLIHRSTQGHRQRVWLGVRQCIGVRQSKNQGLGSKTLPNHRQGHRW